jgi:gluconate 5-dehydrogenase
MIDFTLNGKRALITGGSRGIGLGIAEGMVGAGAKVVLVARHEEELESAAKTLSGQGAEVRYYPFDLSRVDDIPEFYEKIARETGGIDILVNNAGLTKRGPAEDVTIKDWRAVLDLDLTSVFVLSQSFAKERIQSGRKGKIVNIASLLSEAVRKNNAPYAAAKGGIRQLTKALAIDWAQYGINVNAIAPGYIHTELTRALWEDQEFDGWVRSRTPMGRWGSPDDLAGAAVFLASDAAGFITGQILFVDGGWISTF